MVLTDAAGSRQQETTGGGSTACQIGYQLLTTTIQLSSPVHTADVIAATTAETVNSLKQQGGTKQAVSSSELNNMKDPAGVIFDVTYDGRQQETSDDGGVKSTCNKRHETLQHSSVSLPAHVVEANVMEEGNAVNQCDDNPQVDTLCIMTRARGSERKSKQSRARNLRRSNAGWPVQTADK